eukprot:TRINITY_DN2705_c0_g1_i1.p1 TRINITY_DN2705_c0_g1~~TRINITY_DN2705_c0_g1_i1.p1  ORF type:complete len:347 (-),score=41.61 TRINITY_DN2705_c0_g1_i1:189-1229(-)
MKLAFVVVLLVAISATYCEKYINPVIPNANHPDPGVLLYNNMYYAVTTSGDDPNAFPILLSNNLVNWTQVGFVFPKGKAPGWAVSDFWAPEIHILSNNTFAVYFVARTFDGILSVGVALATSPTGPFRDIGKPLIYEPHMGNIDPSFYREGSKNYLIWKRDGNGAVPPVPTPIFIQELTADGSKLAPGSSKTQMITNDLSFEGNLVEGPWLIRVGKYYYLFYSSNGFSSPSYSVSVARATSLFGPYTKVGKPILQTNSYFDGPGHCSVVPLGSTWYIIYHSWYAGKIGGSYPRVLLVDSISWVSDWPVIGDGSPSHTPQPVPRIGQFNNRIQIKSDNSPKETISMI